MHCSRHERLDKHMFSPAWKPTIYSSQKIKEASDLPGSVRERTVLGAPRLPGPDQEGHPEARPAANHGVQGTKRGLEQVNHKETQSALQLESSYNIRPRLWPKSFQLPWQNVDQQGLRDVLNRALYQQEEDHKAVWLPSHSQWRDLLQDPPGYQELLLTYAPPHGGETIPVHFLFLVIHPARIAECALGEPFGHQAGCLQLLWKAI